MKIKNVIKKLLSPFSVKPLLGEDYDQHWGYTDYKDKVVLDLGADYGSTADWFLRKGATKVVAVEFEHYEKLAKWADGIKVVPVKLFVQTATDYEQLITKYKPNIAKIDIEGWEKPLLSADPTVIKTVSEYLIETHTSELLASLTEFLGKLGYKVKHCENLAPGIDVIYAQLG